MRRQNVEDELMILYDGEFHKFTSMHFLAIFMKSISILLKELLPYYINYIIKSIIILIICDNCGSLLLQFSSLLSL